VFRAAKHPRRGASGMRVVRPVRRTGTRVAHRFQTTAKGVGTGTRRFRSRMGLVLCVIFGSSGFFVGQNTERVNRIGGVFWSRHTDFPRKGAVPFAEPELRFSALLSGPHGKPGRTHYMCDMADMVTTERLPTTTKPAMSTTHFFRLFTANSVAISPQAIRDTQENPHKARIFDMESSLRNTTSVPCSATG
jgi:hypothetical protein